MGGACEPPPSVQIDVCVCLCASVVSCVASGAEEAARRR